MQYYPMIYKVTLLILLFTNSQSILSASEKAYQLGDAKTLLEELRKETATGTSGSYNQLWDTYLTAFMKSDGYLKDYYSSYSKFTSKDKDSGSGGTAEGQKYNREHTIPKSWWGGTTSAGTQGADPFIVVPADKYINNLRSSYPFGIVKTAKYTSIDDYSKLGEADTSYGYSGVVFEPNDDVKGDLARAVFYAIAKYSKSYSWTSGLGSVIFSGSESKNFGLTDYAVKLFTEWNEIDPPDEWEVQLNNVLYKIQGNKNPFIEHPEYVNTIWGSSAKKANKSPKQVFKKFLKFPKN